MGVLHSTSRKIEASDIVGKTVSAINNKACNMVRLTFTDGTFLELWTEVGPLGIPVIEIDPNAIEE